jgi:hypothetical protein
LVKRQNLKVDLKTLHDKKIKKSDQAKREEKFQTLLQKEESALRSGDLNHKFLDNPNVRIADTGASVHM